ncbi:EsaB/YukD family protein [Intestinibacter sp.]|uniref:EsaB/YukD family protein n=1 Tax=Intestinibacter sp. TaxID=1965304 RepID=UPI002A74E2DF|nr:EsaB/YukD family protein [Intestinibacter sp.]MDY2736068.1 EsaB/YukD family protein [Intestinibacter sp.]MDY4573975.1 EsaB/YukD family protein [Intestinibacter sp.]
MEVITVVLYFHKLRKQVDLQVPVNITATEFVIGINKAYNLGINVEDLSKCYLRSENPIALLKGDKTLKEFNLINGSIINIL